MYMPGHFAITDEREVLGIIDRRRAGTLVVAGGRGFEASLLPWMLDRAADGAHRLRGHVSRANPILTVVPAPALVIFDVVDGYISPSWYPSKVEHARVVPTWNYVSVHVHGSVRPIDDPGWLRRLVTELTDRQESPRAQPWAVSDAPEDFVEKQLRAVVGLEVEVRRLEGKAKLSQNRSRDDLAGVRAGLAADPDGATLLKAMGAAPN